MEYLHPTAEPPAWLDENQRWLAASLALLRAYLEGRDLEALAHPTRALADIEAIMPMPPALLTLAERFGLSEFERNLLLLCAGVELDSDFAAACAKAQKDAKRPQLTFSLAMAILPGAHWTALGPAAPLRYFHLLELGSSDTLTRSPIRIDEYILHYIAGAGQPDERLLSFVKILSPRSILVPSHRQRANQMLEAWNSTLHTKLVPFFILYGEDEQAKLDIAATVCQEQGMQLVELSPRALDSRDPLLIRLLQRELCLKRNALLIHAGDFDERSNPSRWTMLQQLIERIPSPLFVATQAPLHLPHQPLLSLDVERPTPSEQRDLWHQVLQAWLPSLEPSALEAIIKPLVSRFNLGAATIRDICPSSSSALSQTQTGQCLPLLWERCREATRPVLDELATRVNTHATWDDLVLPEAQREMLRSLTSHVRHHARVFDDWGLGRNTSRGLGVSALFAGPSGTGKTLAAEVLATELRLDLYRIDLSQLVSKYIGETEKNLRRLFDSAEQGSAILLFDEADALFGRRAEIRDSHDRYANLQVAYLLQRMEEYRGLSILTTNMREALDPAFARRLRFIVDFSFPSAEEREAIWLKILGMGAPVGVVDVEQLGRLRLTGGSIRNIVLNAAFMAAETGQAVGMEQLLKAARTEYTKLGRPIPETAGEMGA